MVLPYLSLLPLLLSFYCTYSKHPLRLQIGMRCLYF